MTQVVVEFEFSHCLILILNEMAQELAEDKSRWNPKKADVDILKNY